MKDNFKTFSNMDQERKISQMETTLKEFTKTGNQMVMGNISGRMESSIKDNSLVAIEVGKVSWWFLTT